MFGLGPGLLSLDAKNLAIVMPDADPDVAVKACDLPKPYPEAP